MDWKFLIAALYLLATIYWQVYMPLTAFTIVLQMFKILIPKVEKFYWIFVSAFRFLAPVCKLLWFVLVITHPIVNGLDWTYPIISILTFWYAFIMKDDFGNDPRNKKPSKVKSFVKALGHRLVVVPSH